MFSSSLLVGVIVKALIVGVLVSLCSSLLGVSLVLKRFSMIGDGLSHVGFGALAIATVLDMGNYSLEISIPIVILAAFFILHLNEHSKIKGDAAIAIFSVGAVAIGSLIYNYSGSRTTDICNSLFGSASIITLNTKDLIISIVLSVIVLGIYVIYYNRIFSITFDETFSRATGIKTELYNIMLSVLTAVTVVLGMKMMGAIMISGLIIFPALTSMRVCRSFKSVIFCSAAVSVVCFLIGFFTACRLEYQTGPTVVAVNTAVFLIFCLAGAIMRRRKNNIGE
ncbi:MAG: metal ABC transporter permease [Clostridia bacterium]|nr:metal ABC transporter permease [Clostridia bacterium]